MDQDSQACLTSSEKSILQPSAHRQLQRTLILIQNWCTAGDQWTKCRINRVSQVSIGFPLFTELLGSIVSLSGSLIHTPLWKPAKISTSTRNLGMLIYPSNRGCWSLVFLEEAMQPMLITVLHESLYSDVCIMNEVELLIQICGLHKESKGRGKRALWSISLWVVSEAHGGCAYTSP